MLQATSMTHDPKKVTHATKYLQNVLNDTYGVYYVTHNCHWNVEGPQFGVLHALFGTQYNELFESIDLIAERIRSLGAYVRPAEGENLANFLATTARALDKEKDPVSSAHSMINNLISMNTVAINTCQVAKESARLSNDDETENLLVERITAHQKSIWMLRSFVA